jgi:hypothetical protein
MMIAFVIPVTNAVVICTAIICITVAYIANRYTANRYLDEDADQDEQDGMRTE